MVTRARAHTHNTNTRARARARTHTHTHTHNTHHPMHISPGVGPEVFDSLDRFDSAQCNGSTCLVKGCSSQRHLAGDSRTDELFRRRTDHFRCGGFLELYLDVELLSESWNFLCGGPRPSKIDWRIPQIPILPGNQNPSISVLQ